MPYWDFNDLPRRKASNNVLHGKAFNITKNPKYDGYQRGLDLMVYKSSVKKPPMELLKVKLYLY